jgi:hypothetical protein
MMLFQGVALLIDNGNIGEAAVRLARIIAVVAAPAIIVIFLVNAVGDTESVRLSEEGTKVSCAGSAPVSTFGIVVTALVIFVSVLSVTAGRRVTALRSWAQTIQGIPRPS